MIGTWMHARTSHCLLGVHAMRCDATGSQCRAVVLAYCKLVAGLRSWRPAGTHTSSANHGHMSAPRRRRARGPSLATAVARTRASRRTNRTQFALNEKASIYRLGTH